MMWAQFLNALLGMWLMAAPSVLDYQGSARINDVIVGPIVSTFAIIAIWKVTRPVGKVNVALGVWLVIASWALGYESTAATINQFVVGVIIAGLAMTRAKARGKFGGGWRSLVKRERPA